MGATLKGKLPRLALSLILVITMVLGLMPGAGLGKALADEAETGRIAPAELQTAAETYPLWVGETQVTSANLKGQGWSFTPAANGNPATLTLSGYSYTGPGHMETLQDYDGEWDYYRHAPIFWNAESELVVELDGESSIVVTADPDCLVQMHADILPLGLLDLPHRQRGIVAEGGKQQQRIDRVAFDGADQRLLI